MAPALLHPLIRANNEVWSVLYYDELVEGPGCQLTFMADADAGYYSCAQALERDDPDALDEIGRFYRRRGVAPGVYVDPASPPGLGARLLAAGYVEVPEELERCHVLHLISPAAEPATELRLPAGRVAVIHLDGPGDPLLDAFVAVDAAANLLPPAIQERLARNLRTRRREGVEIHCLVALVDGEVVSTRLVGVSTGEVAVYAEGATLEPFRRLGLYTRLMREGLSLARAAGKRYAFQTAGRDSHSSPAVLALGFTRACTRTYHRGPHPGPR